MGNTLKLVTAEKERCTWVVSEHGGDFLADGSPGQMVVTPDWLDSLSSSAALDVYCVVVGNCSNLSSLVQKTNDQLTSAQQADFTTDKEVEDALGHLCCGLEGDTHYYVRDWLSMLRHISVDSDRGFIPLAQLVAVHMRDKFKGDNPGPFELTGRRCALTDYSCDCGPFCDVRGMQKGYTCIYFITKTKK